MRGPWHGAQCRAYVSEPLLTCSGLNASCADAGCAKASSEAVRIIFARFNRASGQTSRPIHREALCPRFPSSPRSRRRRSEEHTSELQSLTNLVCRLLLEKKKKQ